MMCHPFFGIKKWWELNQYLFFLYSNVSFNLNYNFPLVLPFVFFLVCIHSFLLHNRWSIRIEVLRFVANYAHTHLCTMAASMMAVTSDSTKGERVTVHFQLNEHWDDLILWVIRLKVTVLLANGYHNGHSQLISPVFYAVRIWIFTPSPISTLSLLSISSSQSQYSMHIL